VSALPGSLKKAIEAKDPLTMQALDGVYLIRADVDEWGSENGKDFHLRRHPGIFSTG